MGDVSAKTIWRTCKASVTLFCGMVEVTLVFLTLNACYWIFPKLYYYIADKLGKHSRVAMVIEHSSDYADYLFTWAAYKTMLKFRLEKLTKKQVHLYGPAISVPVISERDRREMSNTRLFHSWAHVGHQFWFGHMSYLSQLHPSF